MTQPRCDGGLTVHSALTVFCAPFTYCLRSLFINRYAFIYCTFFLGHSELRREKCENENKYPLIIKQLIDFKLIIVGLSLFYQNI